MALKDNKDSPFILDTELFARRLSDCCYMQGSTQADISRATGVSPGLISLYMNGRRVPTLETIYAIAYYLGVSIDYLVGNDKEVTSRLQEIHDMYSLERDDKARRTVEIVDEIGQYYQGARY